MEAINPLQFLLDLSDDDLNRLNVYNPRVTIDKEYDPEIGQIVLVYVWKNDKRVEYTVLIIRALSTLKEHSHS